MDAFIRTLFTTTGSDEHIRVLDIKMPETPVSSEEEIYACNNLPYIIPELREGRWEKKWLQENTPIIEEKDIKGILHFHTNFSDGKESLESMTTTIRKMGYEYCGVADHSMYAKYAGGLTPETLKIQLRQIDQLNSSLAPFRILKGLEIDILKDGSLDDMGDIIYELDFTVCSIHAGLEMDEETATRRLLKAIEDPRTIMIGHPTGRLLLRRAGYPLKMDKILDACRENLVIIEINAHPRRLDLSWEWVRVAWEKGLLLSINPDAHDLEGIRDIRWGVSVARRAALPPDAILNAKPLHQVIQILSDIKRKKGWKEILP